MKYLIVGLGNIGPDYENTRHNVGFMVLDHLASLKEARFESGRYAFNTQIKFKGRTFILIKPTTFMNLSGKAVRYWIDKEKVEPENLLIIADDLALPTGKLRIRAKGSDGGHNGLASIIEQLGTTDFIRMRIGIGNTFLKGYQSDYVLGQWTAEETELLKPQIEKAAQAVLSFGTQGVQRTMNFYNNS